jgi:hypothetical protein
VQRFVAGTLTVQRFVNETLHGDAGRQGAGQAG